MRTVPNPPPLKLAELAPRLVERSDDELMVLSGAGAEEAFSALARRHMDRLVNYCARVTRESRAAEEIAQETWLALWAARASYEPRGRFLVWMYTAARRRCLNHLRRGRVRRHESAPEQLDAVATSAPGQVDALLARETQRRLHEALGSLPEAMREAVLLRFAEELPYEQISAILDSGESTIRSRVHLGVKRLRAMLLQGED